MPATEKNPGEEFMRSWAGQYLFKEMNPLQKRLFDWWTGEGFFYVSDFAYVSEGMTAELMLMLGESAYRMIGVNEAKDLLYAATQIESKKNDGWDMIRSGFEGYYYLRDTDDNRARVEELLSENIRNFELLEYKTKNKNGIITLKSVVILIRNREKVIE